MKKKTKLIIAVSVIIVLALLVSVSSIYHKGPWRGKVIDAETGEPIEGAVVVAVWQRVYMLDPTARHNYFLDADETLTNENGEFVIHTKWFLYIPWVREVRGPRFTIFKPAYGSFPRYQVSPKYTPVTLFEGQGATVELPKLKTKDERKEKLIYANEPFSDHNEKKKKFIHLLNDEFTELGLKPYKEQ